MPCPSALIILELGLEVVGVLGGKEKGENSGTETQALEWWRAERLPIWAAERLLHAR